MSSKKFRYDTSKKWYKGNTHIHSTASDGGKTVEELDDLYSGAGYDFLFRTDHWECSDFKNYPENLKLLWIDGVEYDARDKDKALYHIVLLGNNVKVNPGMAIQEAINEGREKDAIIIFAHPGWSGNTTENAVRYDFDGVEIFNYTTDRTNGKSCGAAHLEQMLLKNPATLAFAADDTHLREGIDPFWNGGWIVVNAEKCTAKSVRNAIKQGNYYSTIGPAFDDIRIKDNMIYVKTSPAKIIRLIGPEYLCDMVRDDNNALTEHSFKIPEEWPYVYIEIEDANGKRAWTNNLFI